MPGTRASRTASTCCHHPPAAPARAAQLHQHRARPSAPEPGRATARIKPLRSQPSDNQDGISQSAQGDDTESHGVGCALCPLCPIPIPYSPKSEQGSLERPDHSGTPQLCSAPRAAHLVPGSTVLAKPKSQTWSTGSRQIRTSARLIQYKRTRSQKSAILKMK